MHCAKSTESINMLFWEPTEPCISWVQIPQGEGAIFSGCAGHSKALAIFAALVTTALLQKRDRSIASNVIQQKGSFSMPGKRK